MTVGVAPKNDMSQLPAEAIHWTNSKTFGKYELFTQQNTPLTLESAAAPSLVSPLCHCVLSHLLKQCSPTLPTLHRAKTSVKAERMSLCLVCFSQRDYSQQHLKAVICAVKQLSKGPLVGLFLRAVTANQRMSVLPSAVAAKMGGQTPQGEFSVWQLLVKHPSKAGFLW